MDIKTLDSEGLEKLNTELVERYQEFQSRNLAMAMTRGKPPIEDIRLAMNVLATCTPIGERQQTDGGKIG